MTEEVLNEIGARDVPLLIIFNKIDGVGDAAQQDAREIVLREKYPECLVVSARREEDVAKVRAAILATFQSGLEEAELFLPWSNQKMRGEIFSNCTVLEQRDDETGVFLKVRGEPQTVRRLVERSKAP